MPRRNKATTFVRRHWLPLAGVAVLGFLYWQHTQHPVRVFYLGALPYNSNPVGDTVPTKATIQGQSLTGVLPLT